MEALLSPQATEPASDMVACAGATSASTMATPPPKVDPCEAVVPTWSEQVTIYGKTSLIDRLRSAELPLSGGDADTADSNAAAESTSAAIVALVAVSATKISALVATPSGLLYRFEPKAIERSWWDFAARNYYVVTGNMADRQQLALHAGVEPKAIKGKTWFRKKDADLTGLSLDEIIDLVAPARDQVQAELF